MKRERKDIDHMTHTDNLIGYISTCTHSFRKMFIILFDISKDTEKS